MKLVGTALEWFQKEPEAYITNRRVLQEGVFLVVSQYHPDGIDCKYPSDSPNGPPRIYFGPQCPYLVQGKVKFECYAFHYGGATGGGAALSVEDAMDPYWEKVYLWGLLDNQGRPRLEKL